MHVKGNMGETTTQKAGMQLYSDDHFAFQHGIRHINSIQVRHLPSYITHDFFASAFGQDGVSAASSKGRLSNHGHSTIVRRRRRVSTSSMDTIRSFRPGEGTSRDVGTAEDSLKFHRSAGNVQSEDPFHDEYSQKTTWPDFMDGFITIHLSSTGNPHYQYGTQSSTQLKQNGIVASKSIRGRTTGRPTESRSIMKPKTPTSALHGKSSSSPTSSQQQRGPSTESQSSGSRRTVPNSSSIARRNSVSPSLPRIFPHQQISLSEAPVYMSRFQRISTNASLDVDVQVQEFAEWVDPSSSDMVVSIWTHNRAEWNYDHADGIQENEGEICAEALDSSGYKLFYSWKFDLSDLVPLSGDSSIPQSPTSAPTLLLELAPSGQLYYVPIKSVSFSTRSRLSSSEHVLDHELLHTETIHGLNSPSALERRGRGQIGRRKEVRSAGWRDLVKLASLQAVIYDTRQSLQGILRSTDMILNAHDIGQLRREISQVHCEEQDLRKKLDAMRAQNARTELLKRKTEMQERYALLAEARTKHEEHMKSDCLIADQILEERNRYDQLISHLTARRTSLLSTLAFIFPIELLSASDLLFTILSIPLPIPMKGPDPAPRLSHASYRDINEDSIASALGYAAYVVQLLAAYYGQYLVYPVTYIGSKSLINDKISTMIGPRMFPLYSKGVETYRFEYAVFLLNKNIEMLMADQNLRAMDMRHTLPNLKNLLISMIDRNGRIPSKAAPSVAESYDTALSTL